MLAYSVGCHLKTPVLHGGMLSGIFLLPLTLFPISLVRGTFCFGILFGIFSLVRIVPVFRCSAHSARLFLSRCLTHFHIFTTLLSGCLYAHAYMIIFILVYVGEIINDQLVRQLSVLFRYHFSVFCVNVNAV